MKEYTDEELAKFEKSRRESDLNFAFEPSGSDEEDEEDGDFEDYYRDFDTLLELRK
jgi:hypothetical protein